MDAQIEASFSQVLARGNTSTPLSSIRLRTTALTSMSILLASGILHGQHARE